MKKIRVCVSWRSFRMACMFSKFEVRASGKIRVGLMQNFEAPAISMFAPDRRLE